jgi:hypothetical protein
LLVRDWCALYNVRRSRPSLFDVVCFCLRVVLPFQRNYSKQPLCPSANSF